MRRVPLLLLLGLSALTGCPGFGDKLASDLVAGDAPPTWEADIQPILAQRCFACHGDAPTGGAPNSLSTYERAFEARQRIYERAVLQRPSPMPPGAGITDATERGLIEAWVLGGAPRGEALGDATTLDAGPRDAAPTPDTGPAEDAGPEVDAAPPADPTWENEIGPLFTNRCAFCHGGAAPEAQLDLSTYAGFLAGGASGDLRGGGDPAQSVLIDRLRGRNGLRSMPPQGMFPEVVTQRIEAWLRAGAPEASE